MPNDRRKRLFVIVAMICIGLFIFDKLILGAVVEGWKSRTQRIGDLEKKLQDGERLITHNKADYEKQWAFMLKNSLPPERSEAEQLIYDAMEQWSKIGLTVTSQRPQWITDRDNNTRIEFRIVATGSIEAIARFLYNVERDPRGLRVQDVEISSRDEAGRNLSMSVLLTGVVLRGAKNAS